MYFPPLQHKLRSLLGVPEQDLAQVCARSWQLAPEEEQTVPPALYSPADLERITASGGPAPVTRELENFHCSIARHRATTAFLLKDVDAVNGHLYSRRWKQALMPAPAPIWSSRPQLVIAHATLACTWYGNIYFGHWLFDDLPLHLAAEQTGDPFIFERRPYLHEPAYRELLEIPRGAIHRAHFKELVVIRDASLNAYKRRRFEVLRGRIGARVQARGSERVFIRRGVTGASRALVNASEVETYLGSQGFSILDPEHLSPVEIAARTLGARVVLGIEGSHLAHALLTMAQGGVLCCIQPPWRFSSILREYTHCLNLRYAIVVGHAVQGGFRTDLDELSRMLDQIEAVLHRAVA